MSAVNLAIEAPIAGGTKVPNWCGATPNKGTAVEGTGHQAKIGTSVNFAVYGSL